MGRDQFKDSSDQGAVGFVNITLPSDVLQAAVDAGVREIVICPGGRNSAFVPALKAEPRLKTYYWSEERSAAFFALGRSKLTELPVAVIVTSGTAAAELLPSAMEAYYTAIPLLFITADRPRRFRGSGAPQSAEQVGLFGCYAPFSLDVTQGEICSLSGWDKKAPGHVNVCLEEAPINQQLTFKPLCFTSPLVSKEKDNVPDQAHSFLQTFLSQVSHPLVIVSSLKPKDQESVLGFLQKLNAPVILEGVSGLRERSELRHLQINRSEKILNSAVEAGYPIDGVLRIGGVPTQRLWRDLEYLSEHVQVCSISDVPFCGLSWNRDMLCTSMDEFFYRFPLIQSFDLNRAARWLEEDLHFSQQLLELYEEEPLAEPSLIHHLSQCIPPHSNVYLGNSLPIREWDQAASRENRQLKIYANRGMSGIDGQLSTFLGMCEPEISNWGIFGDLTTLYDLVAPWILPQLPSFDATFVVINNGGGKIFARMYPDPEVQNLHQWGFAAFAAMWGIPYTKWESVPYVLPQKKGVSLIELIPDVEATRRFWNRLQKISVYANHDLCAARLPR